MRNNTIDLDEVRAERAEEESSPVSKKDLADLFSRCGMTEASGRLQTEISMDASVEARNRIFAIGRRMTEIGNETMEGDLEMFRILAKYVPEPDQKRFRELAEERVSKVQEARELQKSISDLHSKS